MAGISEDFQTHVKTGLTTLCRCWAITRGDGVEFGFTDHDMELSFEGLVFKADSGLSALALQQSTGLSVDNSEAVGAMSDVAVTEEDIFAGRFDGAEVRAWSVNWADTNVRWLQFRGSIGEIRRAGGAFHAELRGLTEALNRPVGRIYQKPCTAVLGDADCSFQLESPGYFNERPAEKIEGSRVFRWRNFKGYEPNWFQRGRLVIKSGTASGLWGIVKRDTFDGDERVIELWEAIRSEVVEGDTLRLEAGCDKRMSTCKLKFANLINYQGFPDIPNEDWVMSVPKQSRANQGGSRR